MEFFRILMVIVWIGITHGILPPSWRARMSEAPYIVYFTDGFGYCGGTIIREDIILTAGHCLVNSMPDYNEITVIAGTNSPNDLRDKRAQNRSIEKILVHEKYKLGENEVQAYFDIALIKLSKPLKYNRYLQPIAIGKVNFNQGALIYGFGSTHPTVNHPSDFLLGKNVSFIRDPECQKILDKTKTKSVKQTYEICVTIGYCHGDSGGPLIQIQNRVAKVVGIASWVADDLYGCNIPPAVSLNVADFTEWLNQGLKKLGSRSPFVPNDEETFFRLPI